jgi:hypothetical protein
MNRFLVAVLIASVGGNAVLLARRYASPPGATSQTTIERGETFALSEGRLSAGTDRVAAGPGEVERRGPVRDLWSGLDAGDPKTLLAHLRAAGLSEDDAKAVVRARIEQRFEARWIAIYGAMQNMPYWKSERSMFLDPERRNALRQIQREQEAMMLEVLGETGKEAFRFSVSVGSSALADAKSIPLPEQKQQVLSRILRDYMDMSSDVYIESGLGALMPWDREKLAYLETEKRRDIAAALTPEELETYDLHASNTAQNLRRQLSGFDATEAEFRALYAIESDYKPTTQAEFFGTGINPSPGSSDERRARIKAALGETRYADYERVTDQGFQRAREITARLNLPAENATSAYQLGRDMQRRADELRAATTMSGDERKAAMASLAQEANARLEALLTPDGAKVYKSGGNSSWLRAIEARGGLR